ncbi:hypothetical protein SUGI_0726920 [Cryptomeria japonica]|uniref:molybdate transporter 2 n=1 Tax=Cryptomeria japonica TaxID=3369 RepID=UPI0024149B64|nr:molybdate transporter 2 [Cryptomeria japonica]GLJ36213.1 hypothetical protein SUGI_0726920 [Cryptomeria japonica]
MEEEQIDNPSRERLLPIQEDRSASSVSISLPARLKQNLGCKRIWSEVSGSLGDLGTFVPIVIALTLVNGLDLGTTLIFTGIYNIITGLIWGIPMPVQPMKSIAAVAISEGDHLTIPQIMAAGICTAGILFVLGVTGLMGVIYRLLPLPVVRGVQLSQGLSFTFTAVKYIRKNQNFATGKSEGDRAWDGWDGLILALVSFCFIVMVTGSGNERQENPVGDEDRDSDRDRRKPNRYLRVVSGIPSALIVFLVGIVIAIWRQPDILKQLTLGPSKPQIVSISRNDWKVGFLRAAVPQIPLSVLNSVIAVCKLSHDLFPLKEVTATSVSASVGLMNLVGCWFGAMPVCHGAGGLAGQYRFGARSGASVVFLGTSKMVLGLLLGSSLVKVLTQFPIGLLGVLLLFSGIELAMACRDMNSKQDSFVMLMCTAVSLTGSSAALGFGCGILLYILLKLRQFNYDDGIDLFQSSRRKPSETMA